jgi:hypothetical protein
VSVVVVLGLFAALGSALALNWGYWAQHGVAAGLPPLSIRRPVRSLLLLFRQGRWTLGFLVGIGGWALYVVALRFAPLSLVQAVSAGGVGVLALLAWRLSGTRPARRELFALALALLGIVGLAASLGGSAPASHRGALGGVLVWVGISVVVATAVVALGGRVLRVGAAFGVAAGVLYAAGDVATKATVGGGARIALVAVVLACHGGAFVALQLGFQRGGLLATAGLASLFTNAVPIVAGLVVFGEGLPAGSAGIIRVAAFVAVVLGGAGLARGEPGHMPREPARVSPVVA